jgi:hypothetical protein
MEIQCLYCQKTILNPRIIQGEIVQKFCNKKCKWAYHDRIKTKAHWREFVKKLVSLLSDYGIEIINYQK